MSICSTGLGKANPGAVTQLTADELDQLFTTDELDQLFKRVFGDQLLATIKQTGKVLNKGRSGIYDDLAARRLDAVKDGRSTRITVPSIRRYLAALPRA